MRTIKIITAGFIGFMLALGIWKFGDSGYLERWEKLPAPPQQASELIPTGGLPLFIATSDGKTYRYSDWHNEGWIQESNPAKVIKPHQITTPCNFSAPEFSLFSNAPKDIKNCLQQKTMEGDGYIRSTFIIDSARNIWSWQHIRTADSVTLLFCLPSLGLLIGLVIGVTLVRENNVEETQQVGSTSEKRSQHSVHPTGGSRRVFGHVSGWRLVPAKRRCLLPPTRG